MGMSANISSGDSEDGGYRPMAEINITPMVDVMLVLLIIFMVAAPLMVTGVPIELPKTSAAKLGQSKKPMVVTLMLFCINSGMNTSKKSMGNPIKKLTSSDGRFQFSVEKA